MATAWTLPSDRSWFDTLTGRRFVRAASVAGAAVFVACLIYAVETLLLHCRHRFVESPTEVAMRAFAIPHFLVGWLFLLTSPSMRNRRSMASLAFWLAVGGLMSWLFYAGGGQRQPFLLLGFYSLFLIHEVSDQARMAQETGDVGELTPQGAKFLGRLQWVVIASSILLLATNQLVLGLVFKRSSPIAEWDGRFLAAGWGAFALACLAGWCWLERQRRRDCLAWSEFRTLLGVYAGILLILQIGSLFGSAGFNLIILVHVTTWLVYVPARLSRQREPVKTWWEWIRRTPVGFLTLHLGLVMAVLVLFALRVHLWERVGIHCQMLSSTAFPCWSILHIATSFTRRG